MLSDSAGRVNRSLRAGFLFALPLPASHWAQGNPAEELNWACLLLPDSRIFFLKHTHTGSFGSHLHPHSHPRIACRRQRHLSTAIELNLGRWNTLQLSCSSCCDWIQRIVWMNASEVRHEWIDLSDPSL